MKALSEAIKIWFTDQTTAINVNLSLIMDSDLSDIEKISAINELNPEYVKILADYF